MNHLTDLISSSARKKLKRSRKPRQHASRDEDEEALKAFDESNEKSDKQGLQ